MAAPSFVSVVDTYVQNCGSVLDGHEVTVVALQHVAAMLDSDGVNASLIGQYRMLYRTLEEARTATQTVNEFDEDDDLLSPMR